jgi:hypothetical protein
MQRGGTGKQQRKGLPALSITSLTCIDSVKDFLEITRKQLGGIRKRQIKVLPPRSTALDAFTKRAKTTSPQIHKKPLASSQLQLNRVMQMQRRFLKAASVQAVALL